MDVSALEGIRQSVMGLPLFVLYLFTSLILLGLFTLIYTQITPHHEFRLIRAGNAAAALSFGGAVIGFVIPLAKSVSQSGSLRDLFVWGTAALLVQLLVYLIASKLLRDLPRRISDGEHSAAIFLAALSVGVGLLNAAAMTG